MTKKSTELELRLIDNVSRQSKAITAAMNGLNRSMKGLENFGRTAAGFAASSLAVVGIGRAISDSVGAAMKLQAALGELGIKGDLGSQQVDNIGRRLLEASRASNQTQEALAAGVDAIMGSGLGSDVAIGGIGLLGKTATATGASVDDLAKTLAALRQNLDVAVGKDMTRAFESLVQSGNDGAFELRDMAQYLPALSASASSLGMKGVPAVEELASWLQIARRGAGDSAEAANNLRNAMAKVLSPDTIKNFDKLGIDLPKAIAAGEKEGVSAIETLVKLTKKATKSGRADLLGQLFGDEQVRAFLRPAMEDYEDFLELRQKASRADGVIDRQYETRMKSAAERFKRFSVAINNASLQIGATLLEPLAAGADRLAKSINTMGSRVGILDELAAAWNGFGAGAGFAAGGLGDLYDMLDRAVLGDASQLEADSDRIGRIFLTFKKSGEDLRAALAAYNSADGLGGQMKAIGDGARALADSLGAGGAIAIAAGAAAIARLGFGLARFAVGSTALRLIAIAGALSTLAGSGGEMSAVDWATVAVGIAAMVGPIARLAGSLRRLAGASAGAAVLAQTAGASAGAAAAAGTGFWGGVAARAATLAVPTALAAGAGWALWKGPQRQPESERASYSARVRTAEQDPLAVTAEMNRTLAELKSMRALAEGLSNADPKSPLVQRRGEDLAGRIGGIDDVIATLKDSTATEAGVGKATLDAIVGLRQEIAGLVPKFAPPAPARGATPRADGIDRVSARAPAPASMPIVPMQMPYSVDPKPMMDLADKLKGGLQAAFSGLEALRPGPSMLAGFTAAFATLSASAASTGSAMTNSLNITATPIVNTSSITAATRAVEGLRASMASIGTVRAGSPSPLVQAAPATAPVDGKRAGGGPLRQGMSYLVGERGPEVLTAGTNSYVTPNHRVGGGGGGGDTYHITVNAPSREGDDIAKAIKSRLDLSRQISINDRPVG